MTNEFQSVRTFNFRINMNYRFPVSWGMDNEVDSMEGMDEQVEAGEILSRCRPYFQ